MCTLPLTTAADPLATPALISCPIPHPSQFLYNNITDKEWVINQLNGGGVKFISHNNTIGWPLGKGSVCGDRWDTQQPWMQPGPITATYRAGDIINITAAPTTNHEGFYEFRICPLDAKDSSTCRLLERWAGAAGRRASRLCS
jgi:hypothetical protein